MPDASEGTVRRGGRAFRLLWGFDALVAAVVVFFFFWGLLDGTVSSFNILLWLGMLTVVGVVIGGSRELEKAGRVRAAVGLLLLLAIPGLAFTLFLVAAIVLQPRWN